MPEVYTGEEEANKSIKRLVIIAHGFYPPRERREKGV
jgi:hypothetical protein